MPPPKKDLPGFYFDAEKNRYFPIKGPIPGSKRLCSSSTPSSSHDVLGDQPSGPNKKHHIQKSCQKKQIKAFELLRARELFGRLLIFNKCRYNFEHEFQKLQASHPMVWKYSCTSFADSALDQLYGTVQTTRGLEGTYFLIMGSMKGTISLYEVGTQYCNYGFESIPKHIWPPVVDYEAERFSAPGSIWSSIQASTSYSSGISHIQMFGQHSSSPADDGLLFQNALVTTLGSGMSGGSVNILNLRGPLDFSSGAPSLHRRTSKRVSCDCTIWTADCNHNGTQAVIGTSMGAASINLETGGLSWIYRTKSDVFSQQYDQSGNIVLCGLRNGAIIGVDVRQKQSGFSLSARPHPHTRPSVNQTFHIPPIQHDRRSTKQKFELKRNSNSSGAVFMSSAVCSLVALQSDDQYFLGSSMDGSIKLFDRRLLHRGSVQSYEGHVNSHTRLQLGVDPSETLIMSGGEDCFVRIWSIKSGELIFGDNVVNSVTTTVCWPRSNSASYGTQSLLIRHNVERSYELKHSWGAWLGSYEGMFYIHGT